MNNEELFQTIKDDVVYDTGILTEAQEKEYVKNQVEIVKANAENFKVDVDLYLSYQYNVPSLDAYKDQISLTYKKNKELPKK